MTYQLKRTACAVLCCAALAVGCSDDTAADGGVRVDGVAPDRVERLMRASFSEPYDDTSMVTPATCVKDTEATYFLPLFANAGEAEVECTVPRGTRLVLNAGGLICIEDEVDTKDVLAQRCEEYLAEAPAVQAITVDGVEIDEKGAATSRVFTIDLVEPNVFDAPAGPTNVAYSGRNLTIVGLDPGTHTIRFIRREPPGAEEPFDVDITYRVTLA